jgi:thiamine-phosphate pyrophosphorylase
VLFVAFPYTGFMLRYAITDRAHLPGDEFQRDEGLIRQAARWAAQSIDDIQLREKDLSAGMLAEIARRMLSITRGSHSPTKLLINSRADVAIAVAADGVHLTSAPGSLVPMQIRELYSHAGLSEPVVSVSCHTLAEVAAARETGATLILFGPVFEKRVEGQVVAEGSGLRLLGEAVEVAGHVPVLALGGVTPGTVADCCEAGARGIAGIRLFNDQNATGTS